MTADDLHYDTTSIEFLETLWGEGYLSPGGPEEVAMILSGLDLAGRTVLDVGSGSGGITVSLVERFGAGRVIGIDVEAPVCARASDRVNRRGLAGRIEIRQVAPGPLPFADAEFGLLFSKDSIVHISDKDALAAEAFRVLRPGGWFAASDWMIGHDGPLSEAMVHYLACEALGFGMASPSRYRQALADAGFVDVTLCNRNEWYRGLARQELAALEGPLRAPVVAALGEAEWQRQLRTWRAMIVVLETGEHCPHHLRARKGE